MPIRNAYELSNNHPQKSISATKVKPKPIKSIYIVYIYIVEGIIGGVGLQSPSELLKYKHVFESSDALSFDKIVQFLHKSPHGDDYTPSKTSQAHVISKYINIIYAQCVIYIYDDRIKQNGMEEFKRDTDELL